MSALMRHQFPGNIRELENAVEHAFVVCIDTTIQIDDLPQHILECLTLAGTTSVAALPLEEAEIETINNALERNDFNRTQTASELGISRNTLWRKMKKYGIVVANL
jgi:transcriptional regulator of acetoin/glycerol metabolism